MNPSYAFLRHDVESSGDTSVPVRMDDTLYALLERVIAKYGCPTAIVLQRDETGKLSRNLQFIVDRTSPPGHWPEAAPQTEAGFDHR